VVVALACPCPDQEADLVFIHPSLGRADPLQVVLLLAQADPPLLAALLHHPPPTSLFGPPLYLHRAVVVDLRPVLVSPLPP